jgi:polyisoprenoid-binding protein YceI
MRHVAFALILAIAVPATAQMPATVPGAPDASRVTAGTYKVDPAHTQILWQVDHLGFSLFDGAFADPTGTLTIDPKNPAAATVSIEIPIARLTTTSAKLNEHMLAADFFDAAKYPTATFRSTRIVVTGQTAQITGDLTLRGVTKPVVLDTRFHGAGPHPMTKGQAIGFRATTSIKRSDFGISYGVPMVSDEVKLTINAAFDKVD